MSANQDASQRLTVRFRNPREGSCLTPALLKELESLLEVSFAPDAKPDDAPMRVSTDANNLSAIDSAGAILTPAAKQWKDEKAWDAGTTTELTFDGWAGQGIDALNCMISVILLLDSAEAGVTVKKDPSGTAVVRPQYEITSITSSQLKVKVYNLSNDATVRLRLVQNPPPSDAS